jgi:hypothetical protein
MAKFAGRIMTVLVVMVIAFASSGCTTNNTTERSDKGTVTEKKTEKTTEGNDHGEKVKTETKTTRE